MILGCSKTLVQKHIFENRMQIAELVVKQLSFIAKEMWLLNSPELDPPDFCIWRNVRGVSEAPPNTEDIAELKQMLKITV